MGFSGKYNLNNFEIYPEIKSVVVGYVIVCLSHHDFSWFLCIIMWKILGWIEEFIELNFTVLMT